MKAARRITIRQESDEAWLWSVDQDAVEGERDEVSGLPVIGEHGTPALHLGDGRAKSPVGALRAALYRINMATLPGESDFLTGGDLE